MKKTALIFSALALMAGGCGQATKKQTANEIAVEKVQEIIEEQEENNPIVEEKTPKTEELPENDYSSYTLSENDSYSFITKADWEGVECKYYTETDGYNSMQECIFPNATIQQVYNIAKRIEPNLKTDLPANNLEYGKFDDDDVIVSYEYKKKPKHLFIELFYRGGMTYVEIIEKEKETHLKITWSPD
jgi:hypothetical protein